MTKLILPQWNDFHMHARQGAGMKAFLQAHLAMGCCGILAMPNTKPPVALLTGPNTHDAWSIQGYRALLMLNGADAFENIFTPLYLSNLTTPEMIKQGAKSGLLTSCKYYPPHATTGAHRQGKVEPMPFEHYVNNGVLRAMENNNVILNIHGEAHDLTDEQWLDREGNAETRFYRKLGDVLNKHPDLRVVCEHITTWQAVSFVQNMPGNVAATICPQHLLYTMGTLLRLMAPHLFCMPVVKFIEDREALREVVTDPNNTKFFAGTDSAPHYRGLKETFCGCAAGCFTGGIAPQLYAMAFEDSGCPLDDPGNRQTFTNFLVHNGNVFYGVPTSTRTFTLERTSQKIKLLHTPEGNVVPLNVGLKRDVLPWRIAT